MCVCVCVYVCDECAIYIYICWCDAFQAYESRDEALAKMAALKDKSQKELAQYNAGTFGRQHCCLRVLVLVCVCVCLSVCMCVCVYVYVYMCVVLPSPARVPC